MKRRKQYALLFALCLLIGMMAGCGKNAERTEKEDPAKSTSGDSVRTITDLEGQEVEIPVTVENMIAIPWPWTSIVFAVDGTDEHFPVPALRP